MNTVTPLNIQTVDGIIESAVNGKIHIFDYKRAEWDRIDAVRELSTGLSSFFSYLSKVQLYAEQRDLTSKILALKVLSSEETKSRLMEASLEVKALILEGNIKEDTLSNCLTDHNSPVFCLLNLTHTVDDILMSIASLLERSSHYFEDETFLGEPLYTHLTCDLAFIEPALS